MARKSIISAAWIDSAFHSVSQSLETRFFQKHWDIFWNWNVFSQKRGLDVIGIFLILSQNTTSYQQNASCLFPFKYVSA